MPANGDAGGSCCGGENAGCCSFPNGSKRLTIWAMCLSIVGAFLSGFSVLGLIAMVMIIYASCCTGLKPCYMTAAAILSYVGAILGVAVGVAIFLSGPFCVDQYTTYYDTYYGYYYTRRIVSCSKSPTTVLIMACLGAPFLIAGGILSNIIACRMAREARGNQSGQKPGNTAPAHAEAVLLNNSSVTIRETMDPDGKIRVEKTTTDEHGIGAHAGSPELDSDDRGGKRCQGLVLGSSGVCIRCHGIDNYVRKLYVL